MTPKQKASELFSKYNSVLPPEEAQYELVIAKKCAIICVDEIINETSLGLLLIEWWKDVKKEIELL